MSEVERIKLVTLDNSVTKRQISSNSKQSHQFCSCLNCLGIKRKKRLTSENIDDIECLNTELLIKKENPKLHTVKTEAYMTESELNELKSRFTNGLIKIQDSNGIISNQEGNKYLNFKFDFQENLKINEQLKLIPKFMSKAWSMKSPQIIIPIVTGVTNFKNWRNQKLEEQFRRGIVKAANKTEMWFITNGINGGISAMVGEAFNEERVT